MNPQVSVVVPVYNVQAYIGECVQSLRAQTFRNFEVVMIDDGSTDGSIKRAQEAAAEDERFRFFTQENAGPATARNKGMDEACGNYLMFLDPDDRYLPFAIERLFTLAQEHNLDYIDFTAHTFYESQDLRSVWNEDWFGERKSIISVMTGPELFARYVANSDYCCSSCFHFFKRSLVQDGKTRFCDGMYVHEDEFFSPQLIACAHRAAFVNEPLYERRVRGASLMTQGRGLRNVSSMFKASRGLEAWLEEHHGLGDADFEAAMESRVNELRYLARIDAATLTNEELFAIRDELPESDRESFVVLMEEAMRLRDDPPKGIGAAARRAVDALHKARRRVRAQENRRQFERSTPAYRRMGRNPLLTVLVPIYNAGDYLNECLDSLVKQQLEEIEILCLNDGSADESADIVAQYAIRDSRVRMISKPNSGYGDTMNKGLAAARGKWIGICEPDDFCDLRMFAELVKAGERFGCDIVKSNYCEHQQGNLFDSPVKILDGLGYDQPFNPRDELGIFLVAPTIWTAIYRRSLIEDNAISFSPTPGASYQDASFGHQCWLSAQRAVLLSSGFYHYRIDNEASSSKDGAKVFAICGEYERTFDFLAERGPDEVATYGPTLNLMRHGVYLWNYNRIAPQYREAFAARWAHDLIEAYDRGLLDLNDMTPGYRQLFSDLLDGAQVFCEKYPDDIAYPPIKQEAR